MPYRSLLIAVLAGLATPALAGEVMQMSTEGVQLPRAQGAWKVPARRFQAGRPDVTEARGDWPELLGKCGSGADISGEVDLNRATLVARPGGEIQVGDQVVGTLTAAGTFPDGDVKHGEHPGVRDALRTLYGDTEAISVLGCRLGAVPGRGADGHLALILDERLPVETVRTLTESARVAGFTTLYLAVRDDQAEDRRLPPARRKWSPRVLSLAVGADGYSVKVGLGDAQALGCERVPCSPATWPVARLSAMVEDGQTRGDSDMLVLDVSGRIHLADLVNAWTAAVGAADGERRFDDAVVDLSCTDCEGPATAPPPERQAVEEVGPTLTAVRWLLPPEGDRFDVQVEDPSQVVAPEPTPLRPEVEAVFQRYKGQLRYCYAKELRASPDLAGTVHMSFVIGKDGTVVSARVAASTLDHEGVEACVLGHVRRMRFPEPAEGKPVTVVRPVEFAPAPM